VNDTERLHALEVGQATTQEAIISIRDALQSFSKALDGIKKSMETIATLETHHDYTRQSIARAFVQIKKTEDEVQAVSKRVTEIEKVVPSLVEARGWVILGMLGTLAIVFGAVIYMVVKL